MTLVIGIQVMCEIVGIKFSASIDDFSGRPPSDAFLNKLEAAYQEMRLTPPPTVMKVLTALHNNTTQ